MTKKDFMNRKHKEFVLRIINILLNNTDKIFKWVIIFLMFYLMMGNPVHIKIKSNKKSDLRLLR